MYYAILKSRTSLHEQDISNGLPLICLWQLDICKRFKVYRQPPNELGGVGGDPVDLRPADGAADLVASPSFRQNHLALRTAQRLASTSILGPITSMQIRYGINKLCQSFLWSVWRRRLRRRWPDPGIPCNWRNCREWPGRWGSWSVDKPDSGRRRRCPRRLPSRCSRPSGSGKCWPSPSPPVASTGPNVYRKLSHSPTVNCP